jgi:hypothetical protein
MVSLNPRQYAITKINLFLKTPFMNSVEGSESVGAFLTSAEGSESVGAFSTSGFGSGKSFFPNPGSVFPRAHQQSFGRKYLVLVYWLKFDPRRRLRMKQIRSRDEHDQQH